MISSWALEIVEGQKNESNKRRVYSSRRKKREPYVYQCGWLLLVGLLSCAETPSFITIQFLPSPSLSSSSSYCSILGSFSSNSILQFYCVLCPSVLTLSASPTNLLLVIHPPPSLPPSFPSSLTTEPTCGSHGPAPPPYSYQTPPGYSQSTFSPTSAPLPGSVPRLFPLQSDDRTQQLQGRASGSETQTSHTGKTEQECQCV
jgi:hypothetical protein